MTLYVEANRLLGNTNTSLPDQVASPAQTPVFMITVMVQKSKENDFKYSIPIKN
jgi:hypothetical protein